jgi:YHS domain-containing protein
MLKILTFGFIIFFVYVYIKKKKKKDEIIENAIELVKDPICDIYVNRNTPYKVKYYDNIYYFCSEKCQNNFIGIIKQQEVKK